MRFFLFSCLLSLFLVSNAQSVDYDWVIPTDSAVGLELEEKLIRLAWKNYPQNKILQQEVLKAQEQVKQSKIGWLKPLSLQFYYGEPHINPEINANFFPRYNLGINMNIGELAATPSRIREKKADLEIAAQAVNMQRLMIRAEVIRRYQNYLMKKDLLKVHIQIQEQANSSFLDITRKFKDGRANLADYTNTALIYNQAVERQVESSGEVKRAKAAVEELIGVPLESVQ